jgi:hypothetical protein
MRASVKSRDLSLVCEKYTGWQTAWQGFRPDSYSGGPLMVSWLTQVGESGKVKSAQ